MLTAPPALESKPTRPRRPAEREIGQTCQDKQRGRLSFQPPSLGQRDVAHGAQSQTRLVAIVAARNLSERVGPDDRNDLQDQRKPSIHLDQEPAIVVREMSAALHLTSQDHQLDLRACRDEGPTFVRRAITGLLS